MVDFGSDGQSVTAEPDTGYTFDEWSDGVQTATRTDTNVTNDVFAIAFFSPQQFSLDYIAGTGGSISGPNPQTVDFGSDGQPVTAEPDTGYTFVQWDDGNTNATRTDTEVESNLTFHAEFAINEYTLTYNANTGGSISGPNPQTVDFGTNGDPVTAEPDSGFRFDQWDDEVTDNPRTDLNVSEDITVTAEFIQTFTLDYAAGTGGDVTGNLSQVVDINTNGTPVEAEPASGFRFVQWSDEVTDNPRTDLDVTANVNVTAEFVQTFTLDYTAGTGGSIDGDDEQVVDINTDGDPVEAIADSGFRFVQWSDESTENPRTDTNVTSNVSVTAEFVQVFTLDYAAGAGGDVSGNLSQVVDINTNGTPVEAEPDSGFRFVQWSDESTENPRTDLNVTENVNVTAEFVQTFTLDYAAGTGGDVSGNLSQVVDINTNGTPVEAEPDSGFRFVQWSDESTENPRTDLEVTENVNVTAEFIQTFTVVYNVDAAEGSITGNTEQVVDINGDATTVTAEAATGYTFSQWSDGILTAERTDTDVTTNINVTAEFTLNNYALIYAAGPNGEVTGNLSQNVDHGESGTPVTAEPDTDFVFVQWSDGVTENPRTDTNVLGPVNVTAEFAQSVFQVVYTAGDNGSITGTATQNVADGNNSAPVTATPAPGYSFIQWDDGSTDATRFEENVTENLSFTATFADVTAPVSSLDVTANTTRAGATVSLDYTVVELGGGLDEVELFVRAPGSATFEPTGVTSGDLTGTFVYTGTDGNGLYEFATAAVDNDANAEATPTEAEVSILWNLVENGDFTMEVTSADHTTTHPMTNEIDILISIEDADIGGTITVSRTPGNNAPGTALDANKLLDEFITITGDGLGTGWMATITWNFDPDNALGIDGNLDMVFQFDGTTFLNQYPVTGTNPLTIGPITSFSDWYAGDASSDVDEWIDLMD
ncbi:MAG: InlB B-repeat-containing protein [Candidatus Sumerlaeia bacterium]|nr:InlB B-repeat-containing protein [Candidatus Sumerlaeia bacterium]